MPHKLAAIGIALIIIAILATPLLSLETYNWMEHTTSELGGQSMPGAILMNLGFAAYGIFTLMAALLCLTHRPLTNAALSIFGIGLIGAAVFSALPIDPSLPGSISEDKIHSFFASLIGFAFAAATASVLFGPRGEIKDWLSWIGLIASVALPLAMLNVPAFEGALQRLMFSISFIWVWRFFRESGPYSFGLERKNR